MIKDQEQLEFVWEIVPINQEIKFKKYKKAQKSVVEQMIDIDNFKMSRNNDNK